MRTYFEQAHIPCTDAESEMFSKLLEEFVAYNSHTNLSAVRDAEGIIVKHFVDSAELLWFEKPVGKLLDIGTGGGFPGIPLKILAPDLDVTLLDSVGKKTKACEHFIRALGLSGIRAIHGRAEEIAKQNGYRKQFDVVVSRATAYLPSILSWAEPFLKERGMLVLYKSPSPEEMADGAPTLRKLRLHLARTHEYVLADQTRKLLIYERDRT